MRVLITGAGGQLGRELVRTAPPAALVKACARAELDIGDSAAVTAAVAEFAPTVIVNAAAYTGVDRAESERELAWQANAHAPGVLARAASQADHCRLIHISTDYVFTGDASRPYAPDDQTGPLGVYGESKLAGERAVSEVLAARALILRTAWVYGPEQRNFLHTILRAMRERGVVRVVADQIGCPTSTESLAGAVWGLAARPALAGIFHWTDAGVASWYDFATAIREEAAARDLLPPNVAVLPIATADYPTPARRPRFSLLDWRGTATALDRIPSHWRVQLRRVLDEIRHG